MTKREDFSFFNSPIITDDNANSLQDTAKLAAPKAVLPNYVLLQKQKLRQNQKRGRFPRNQWNLATCLHQEKSLNTNRANVPPKEKYKPS
jgi:hypothetical protein